MTTKQKPLIPFPYQIEAIKAGLKSLKDYPNENPLISAPTGSGKSIIIACLCQILIKRKDIRIAVISDSKQILLQDYKAIQRQVDCEVGLYSSGLKRKDTSQKIVVAGIQSIYKKAHLFEDRTFFIIDEAHKVGLNDKTIYQIFFRTLKQPKIGLTATDFRTTQGYLYGNEGDFFHKLVFSIGIRMLQAEGRLCFMKSAGARNRLDPTGLKKYAGDYSVKDMSLKFDIDSVTRKVTEELASDYKDTRSRWLVFSINTEHADNITAYLNKAGVESEVVHSKRKNKTNDEKIEAFRHGKFQALVSVGMLTTGFDVPEINLIVLLRPTASSVLNVQMIGRGLRMAEGKIDCWVADYCGNLIRCGPIDDPIIKIPGKKGSGEAPLKECSNENCRSIVPIGVRVCPECGFEFLFAHKVSTKVIEASIIREQASVFKVDEVTYSVIVGHRKKLPIMQTRYQCGVRRFFENIYFEHPHPTTLLIARKWWEEREGIGEPKTCQDAVTLSGSLKKPKEITIKQNGKYTDIENYIF